MRAVIDSTGTLTIVPENETEAYALRCYQEKFNSDTPPAICFQWDKIHSPKDVKPAKGAGGPGRYWPFNQEETDRVLQGLPPLTKAHGDT